MSVYIFAGLTITAAEGRPVLDAVYLPPARQGDVYRVAQGRPQAIGLIDGLFDQPPAVWHKEILWAMQAGVHVFGAAGLGALRAAELNAFGMEGVGHIFTAYQHGDLDADDEVAVAYSRRGDDYRPTSVALVDIRATLAVAEEAGIITTASRAALTRHAKTLYYPERTCSRLLDLAVSAGLVAGEVEALAAWLPSGQVHQQRADALRLLTVMSEDLARGMPPKQVRYHFEHTVYWEQAIQRARIARADHAGDS